MIWDRRFPVVVGEAGGSAAGVITAAGGCGTVRMRPKNHPYKSKQTFDVLLHCLRHGRPSCPWQPPGGSFGHCRCPTADVAVVADPAHSIHVVAPRVQKVFAAGAAPSHLASVGSRSPS